MSMELPRKISFGDWLVDRSSGELSKGDSVHRLQTQPLQILEELLSHPGEIVTREQLIARLWPKGIVDFDTGLNTAMRKLRIALGDDAETPRYIETIPRRGYRLLCSVDASIDQGSGKFSAPTLASIPAESATPASGAPQQDRTRSWFGPRVLLAFIAVVFAIAAAYAVVNRTRDREASAIGAAAIVVMPFTDLTEAKKEQAFCDGLAEELSNWLAQVPALKVVARTSAVALRERNLDAREIGSLLGVTHVLQGALRRQGGRLRITVQLIGTKDGFQLWSGSYDLDGADVIQVQEQLARAVTTNLELRLTPTVDARFADRHGTSPRAYSSYLLARHHQQQLTREDNERAIELYRAATAEDPAFSLAKVGLARALLNQRYFSNRSIGEIEKEAGPLLASVAGANPDLPDLYVARGALATDLNDAVGAVDNLRRAVQLNPNSIEATTDLGYYHLMAGEPRVALEYYTQAVGLDPLSFNSHAMRCLALADLARFDDASFACERARALNDNASWPWIVSSLLEQSRGDFASAWRWTMAAANASPNTVDSYADRGVLLIQLGAIAQAKQVHDAGIATLGASALESPLLMYVGLLTSVATGNASALEEYIASREIQSEDDVDTRMQLARAWLLAGKPDRARTYVDAALNEDGGVSTAYAAWYARAGNSDLITVAATLIQTGEPAKAERYLSELEQLLDRLERNGVQRSGIFELRAQLFALRGDPEKSMQALKRAAQLGWRSVWQAQHEPYLSAVREREDFRALARRIQSLNERDLAKIEVR